VSDLMIAHRMHWRYEWVADLPRPVHDVLVEELQKAAT
jgi:hypothetical protein